MMRVGARILVLLSLVLGLTAASCGGEDAATDETTTTAPTREAAPTETSGASGKCETAKAPDAKPDGGQTPPEDALETDTTYLLKIETNCGSFTIDLDQQKAPETAASLVALAKDGFFDGTIFHRVVPGFVIQGGDPTGTGTGGPGYQTVDPPPANATYTKGVVAMAKAGFEAPGTAGSQFFVVTGADVGLPAEYAIVGKITDGIESVTAIDRLGIQDGPPSKPVVIERVTVEEG